MEGLSSAQQEMVQTFLSVSNTGAVDSAVAILEANQWDLQTSISQLYDTSTVDDARDSTSEETRPLMDQFEIDDAMPPAGVVRRDGATGGAGGLLRQLFGLPLLLITYPLGWVLGGLGLVARLFRLRGPGNLTGLRPRNPFHLPRSTRPPLSPRSAAERWVRELEESGRGAVPEFLVMGYDEALRKAKSEVKVLMVVIGCEENENEEEFRAITLRDPELLRTLEREGVLCWGGDLRDRDAYQAAHQLHYLSLPFIGFLAPSPPSSTLQLITRLEGPSATIPASLVTTHLTTAVLPRVTPYLARLRTQEAARVAERRIRREQDDAYQRAARTDEERVLKKRRELKEAEAARERLERESSEREAQQARDVAERELKRTWREWRWSELMQQRNGGVDGPEGGVRIGVRLGDGRRVVRRFLAASSPEELYAFVDCSLSPPTTSSAIPLTPPRSYSHTFEFTLASTFPRHVISLDALSLQEAGVLEGASLVVEGLEKRRISLGERPDDSDEEEEEEEEEEE